METIVNNFSAIRDLVEFDGKSVFLVIVVVRNKDGHPEAKGESKNRTITSYYFQTEKELMAKEQEITTLCRAFKCRAYICINKKPQMAVLFSLMDSIKERMKQTLYSKNKTGLYGIIGSAVMKTPCDNRKHKYWVVDVDTKDTVVLEKIKEIINGKMSAFSPVVVDTIPTAHGNHIITHPFRDDTFAADLKEAGIEVPEIKKDGLTLLFAWLDK